MLTTQATGPFLATREVHVPDGTYRGTWGGYQVTIDVAGQSVWFRVPDGIRTPDCPVVVVVTGGRAAVTTDRAAAGVSP